MRAGDTAPGYRSAFVVWLLAIAAFGVVVLLVIVDAPDPMPSHFAADGEVDGYSSKASMLVTLVPIGVGLPFLLGLPWPWARWPALLNVPHKDAWIARGHREELSARVVTFLRLIGALCALLLGGILAVILHDARTAGVEQTTSNGVLIALILGFLAGVALCIVKLMRDLSPRALEAVSARSSVLG